MAPEINLRIPIAMIEQKLEAIKGRLGGRPADLTAQLAASLAVRKVSIPDANCRVGNAYPAVAHTPAVSRPAGPPEVIPPPPAGPHTEALIAEIAAKNALAGIASILSPSQVRTWFDCQARWYYGHVAGLPDPKNSNLALGIAVHDALAHNFRNKLDTGHDLPAADVTDVFDVAWGAVLQETDLREEEEPSELATIGRGLVAKFMRDQAREIRPAKVEQELKGEVAGVKVQGRLDLLDVEGRVHDWKVLKATPQEVEPDQFFALGTYSYLSQSLGASGEVRVHALIKTKTPRLVQLTRTLSEEDYRALQVQYPLAQEGMRAGLYMPNRQSMLCSRRNCSFWRACEEEFGGRIPKS